MEIEHWCEGKRGSGMSCRRRAKVEREGKWYCGTHDPVAVEERRQQRESARHQEIAAERDAWLKTLAKRDYDERCGDLARGAGATAEDLTAGRVRVVVDPDAKERGK